jgi:hypothetical protein
MILNRRALVGGLFFLPNVAYSKAIEPSHQGELKDDTSILQALFDKSRNRRLILPAGQFRITRSIKLDAAANYSVAGQGAEPNAREGTVIVHDGRGAAIEIAGRRPGVDNFIYLSDFSIRGTANSGSGIDASWVHGLKLERLWLTTLRGHGISLSNCWGCKLSNTVITHAGGDGLRIIDRGNLISIRDSTFNGNGALSGANIRISGEPGNENLAVTIDGCDFSSAPDGLVMQHLWSPQVRGCYSETCPRLVWADSTVRGLIFQSNYLQDGVATFDGVEALDLSGNTFNAQTKRTELRIRRAPNTRLGPNNFKGGAAMTEFHAPRR